jgi:hypothetical protein
LQVVVAVDCEQEHFLVAELQTWRFFGLNHRNVAILPLPRFHGFAQVWIAAHCPPVAILQAVRVANAK